ncbi:MAG: hypothetical protein U0K47_09750, partial [Erysipelotrichaceae bacterium]|nr:hypothetical protein [Erysipelotrichaceae bacterium]
LEDCFHYMLYQEAVMKIFTFLGIPMKDSYDTIKKISKKKLKGAIFGESLAVQGSRTQASRDLVSAWAQKCMNR